MDGVQQPAPVTDISSIPLPGSVPLPPDPIQTTQTSDLPGSVPRSEVKAPEITENKIVEVTTERPARIYNVKKPTDAYGSWETVRKQYVRYNL